MTVIAPTFDDLLAGEEDTYSAEFEAFLGRHPEVWTEIVRIVSLAKDRGQTRVSLKWVFESIRQSVPRDGRQVALNNNWSAPAARKLVAQREDLAPLIKIRRRKS